jgi:hypothetical protein
VAERLAKDGLAIVINYSRGSDVAQALVAKIKQAGALRQRFKRTFPTRLRSR